ncbi:hypothetical protein EW146_g1984 [Bondarzewia mesenterica]|uniref:MalT-like TPR region domain-containing protein n=1 Tax=Bondarzewia mesenterica TaxID=1095465 RepID=A0A4S4M259_9AGAM|nr:hypothetical protein EW146_g1984 [Bondarzewia mesenterica]
MALPSSSRVALTAPSLLRHSLTSSTARITPQRCPRTLPANLASSAQQARAGASKTYSTASLSQTSSFRITTVFSALIVIGMGATGYQFYNSFTMWPQEVRADLRAGVKAKQQGDFILSARYLQRAYETALTLSLDSLSPSPYLKISGIASILGDVLESSNRPKAAYEFYEAAFSHLQTHHSELTGEEQLRAVALAHKLGAMADTYHVSEEEEERWLTWAVEEGLRIAKSAGKGKTEKVGEDPDTVVLSELDLPGWMRVADVGAPIEALGAFYARTGKTEYAIPLYLQAISLLVPPPNSGKTSSAGAQLMSNLSELLMRGSPTPQKLHQADAWARQALSVIEKTQKNSRGPPGDLETCEQALAATLFNLASLREMRGDLPSALEMFQRSFDQSKKIGMREGMLEARQALRRVDRTQHALNDSARSPTGDDKTKRIG